MEIPEIKEHKEVVRIMRSLPELSAIELWTQDQSAYLKTERNFWKHLGAKLDYLQMQQLGYRPENPTGQIQHPIYRKQVDAYGGYLFAVLQVMIAGFDDIERLAQQRQVEFNFKNPRELFAQACREFSSLPVTVSTTKEIGQGFSLSETRSGLTYISKFYRDSLPSDESLKLCDVLEEKGGWMGFAIAAIHSGASQRYLKKPSTPIGYAWKQFKDAQKELRNFFKKEKLRTLKWNCGYAVFSDNGQPVDFHHLYIS